MITLLNFSHPLSDVALCEIGEQMGETHIQNIPVNLVLSEPMEPQVAAIVAATGLTSDEWQTQPICIIPPGMSPAAGILLAILHGLMGHFPSQVRLVQRDGSFHLAEALDLQEVRNRARQERFLCS